MVSIRRAPIKRPGIDELPLEAKDSDARRREELWAVAWVYLRLREHGQGHRLRYMVFADGVNWRAGTLRFCSGNSEIREENEEWVTVQPE